MSKQRRIAQTKHLYFDNEYKKSFRLFVLETIEKLQTLVEEVSEDATIDIEKSMDDACTTFIIHSYREETDKEYRGRLKEEAELKERHELQKTKDEANERKLYLKLKKKYERSE